MGKSYWQADRGRDSISASTLPSLLRSVAEAWGEDAYAGEGVSISEIRY